MKSKTFILIGALFAVLAIISSAAASDKVQAEGANQIASDGSYGGGGNWGGGGGNWGGGGGNWGGGGGGGGWGGGGGGSGGHGGGWGGGGGGWGGGRPCRWGCCGTNNYGGGGCRCCYGAQEAIAYLQYVARN